MDIKLKPSEKIEDLQCNGLKIIQDKNLYTFTSDSVILANFIKLKPSDVCGEIGTGCGIIPVLLSAKTEFSKIYTFEIQPQMASLAEKNIYLNNVQNKIQVISDDVKNFKEYLPAGSLNVVFSNPPYLKTGEIKNDKVSKSVAKHEDNLLVDELCSVASKMLKFGGKFYVIFSSTRACELIEALMRNNLEPKRMFFTNNGKNKITHIVVEAVKGGKHGVEVLPELVTNDKKGDYVKFLQTRYVGKIDIE